MSNGGGEAGREHDELLRKTKPCGNDFARAIAKIAVAQICESTGFQTFQQSALETLSEIAVRYMQDVGKTAHSYAGLAGRVEVNVFDIIQGLEDLGSGLGFGGASDADHCLAASGIVKDIVHYIDEAENIPFAYSIRPFPVVRHRKATPSFLQAGEEPPPEHIPAWLPAFPHSEVYIQSQRESEREIDNQRKEKESSLLNFQKHFAADMSEGPSTFDGNGAIKSTQGAEGNPFLAAPLRFGEKEVSLVEHPAKRSIQAATENTISNEHVSGAHVSVLETFGPALEAMKSRLCDSEPREKIERVNQRPHVQFKLGIPKKSVGSRVELRVENQDLKKITPWFGEEDEKDEKKRKAQRILKESMENMEELA